MYNCNIFHTTIKFDQKEQDPEIRGLLEHKKQDPETKSLVTNVKLGMELVTRQNSNICYTCVRFSIIIKFYFGFVFCFQVISIIRGKHFMHYILII